MDPNRFDELTRALANGISRRQALRLITATLMGAAFPEIAVGQVHAQVGTVNGCCAVGCGSTGTCCGCQTLASVCCYQGYQCCSYYNSSYGGVVASCCGTGVICDPNCPDSSGCLVPCGPGETRCNECDLFCNSLQTDPGNCGTCGTVCPSGQCVNGHCTCPPNYSCPSGQTCCNGTCVSGQCGGNPQLIIDVPAKDTKWPITAAPAMPTINAQAHIAGVTPDPTSTTAFTWSGQIQFNAQTCGGPSRAINLTIPSETIVGGKFTPKFSAIRGGKLILTVSAVVNGQTLTKSTSGVVITGTNPSPATIGAALGNDTLRKIACFESQGMRQFDASANGGQSSCPVLASDGGIGIMQITRWNEVEANGTCGRTTSQTPPDDLFWDWTKNVAAGIAVFNQKLNTASQYPSAVSNTSKFKQLALTSIAYWQRHGYPNLKTIVVPPFNNNQTNLDAIRGYNGWCGRDAFGCKLHEFRLKVNTSGILVITVSSDGKTGTATWEPVPAADRPTNCGCQNYINCVTNQNATCPSYTNVSCVAP